MSELKRELETAIMMIILETETIFLHGLERS